MEFVKHRHPLVLNEFYHGGEGDACYLCKEPLRSPFAHSVYLCTQGKRSSVIPDDDDDDNDEDDDDAVDFDCDKMLVHKSCAELPLVLTDSYMHPQHPITLKTESPVTCSICYEDSVCKVVYYCGSCTSRITGTFLPVCLKCVTSPLVYHPSHNQHTLQLVQHQASFRCNACGKKASDSSSCKCTICPFWIHMSCAVLSSSFQSQFHRHPLLLAYSLPQQYLNFDHKCKICMDYIKPTLWLYYCAGCRMFVHIHCANAPPETKTRALGEFGDLVHLPTRDESSVNMFRQLLIHQMMINQGQGDALTWSFSSISTITAADVAGPYKEVIHHWSHDQHPLNLVNKCSTAKIQLVALKDNGKDSDDDSTVIVCDGCTYPINSSNTSYYECHPCKYFLHMNCAKWPKQMQPYKFGRVDDDSCQIIFTEISSSYLFKCDGCNYLKSGIHMDSDNGRYKLDIGCAMLLRKDIDHKAHGHPLTAAVPGQIFNRCNACMLPFGNKELILRCDICADFRLHTQCALRPRKLKHPWDSHPLTLITPENIVENHPHDHNCEHCSEDIDTNYWFYHCSLCDLSCHIACINSHHRYSNIKFGSSSIKIDHQLHEHGLTLVLNKRKRCCGSCNRQLYNAPVLQCTPCNFIICVSCVDPDQFDYPVACGRSQVDLPRPLPFTDPYHISTYSDSKIQKRRW